MLKVTLFTTFENDYSIYFKSITKLQYKHGLSLYDQMIAYTVCIFLYFISLLIFDLDFKYSSVGFQPN